MIALTAILGLGGLSGVGISSAQAQGFAPGEYDPRPRPRPYSPPYWGGGTAGMAAGTAGTAGGMAGMAADTVGVMVGTAADMVGTAGDMATDTV